MRIEEELTLALELQKPCIWVKTIEEADFINQFLKFAKRKIVCNKVYSWSLAKGMMELDLEGTNDKLINKSPGLAPIIQHIETEREQTSQAKNNNFNSSSAIRKVNMYLLKDLHLVIDKPDVMRGIREILLNYIEVNHLVIVH